MVREDVWRLMVERRKPIVPWEWASDKYLLRQYKRFVTRGREPPEALVKELEKRGLLEEARSLIGYAMERAVSTRIAREGEAYLYARGMLCYLLKTDEGDNLLCIKPGGDLVLVKPREVRDIIVVKPSELKELYRKRVKK